MSRKAQTKPVKTKKKKNLVCFTIMPFGDWPDDYYESIYSPAIRAVGLDPHRADDLFRPSTIVTDIWSYTKKAKVLLADLTGKNPNVFYELGLAHALAKPAILIAESMNDIPFDLRALRIIVYDKNAPDWGNILRGKIESSLREVMASPVEAVLPAFLDIKSAGAKPSVSAGQKDLIEIKQDLELLRREFRDGEIDLKRAGQKRIIDPAEAKDSIRRMMMAGMSDGQIIRRLSGRGPSSRWVISEIQLNRKRLRRR